MNYPKIYIIILNYNGWADTIECLESVLRNDYPNYQVIVVDNNSPNNSIDYIKAWAEGKLDVWVKPDHPLRHLSFPPVKKPIPYVYYGREEAEKGGNLARERELKTQILEGITSKYPLVFIQTGENLGFAGGNNMGIKYALAKDDFGYVCLLNNDTVIEWNFLSNLIETIKVYPEAGIVGGKILYYDRPDKIWYAGGKLDLWRGGGYHLHFNQTDNIENGIRQVSFVTGCLMLIDKKVFKSVGLFPEEYFLYLEDTDFCYSALQYGFKLYVNLSAKIYHKVSVTTAANKSEEVSSLQIYYSTRNRLYFMLKRQRKLINKIVFLVFFVSTRLVRIVQWTKNGKFKNVRAMIDAIMDTRRVNR